MGREPPGTCFLLRTGVTPGRCQDQEERQCPLCGAPEDDIPGDSVFQSHFAGLSGVRQPEQD